MCGDTSALTNPGPIGRNFNCNICEEELKTNSIILSCLECDLKVHKKCENINLSSPFVCNFCISKSLPFHDFIDIANNNSFHVISDINDVTRSFIDLNKGCWECFKKKGLHFIHANTRSIFHKLPELKQIAEETQAAVIAITETWLDSSYPDASVSIDGYNIIRRDRLGHAGGVCAYIREGLAYNARPDLNNTDLEDLWFEILLPKSKPLYVGVCYRTDNKNSFFGMFRNQFIKVENRLRFDCTRRL